MKLHLDQNAFRVLIENIHEKTGYRTDVLEKNYYVVLILRELADMQRDGLQAYFKGGTALNKALKTTRWFSEDIDLSVDTRGCSTAQNNKRLERATKRYSALSRDPLQNVTYRSEVIAAYNYTPVTAYDANDALQRFGKLKLRQLLLPSASRQKSSKYWLCSMILRTMTKGVSSKSSCEHQRKRRL